VLDNLIHRLDVAETIVALVSPGDRLVEYANWAAHARYLTAELVPRLEAEFPLAAVARCSMLDGRSRAPAGRTGAAFSHC
jgi:enterochelin esterase family protein